MSVRIATALAILMLPVAGFFAGRDSVKPDPSNVRGFIGCEGDLLVIKNIDIDLALWEGSSGPFLSNIEGHCVAPPAPAP